MSQRLADVTDSLILNAPGPKQQQQQQQQEQQQEQQPNQQTQQQPQQEQQKSAAAQHVNRSASPGQHHSPVRQRFQQQQQQQQRQQQQQQQPPHSPPQHAALSGVGGVATADRKPGSPPTGIVQARAAVFSKVKPEVPPRRSSVTGVKAYNDPAASLRGSGQRSNSQGSGGGGGGGGGGSPLDTGSPRSNGSKLVSQGSVSSSGNRLQRQRSLKHSNEDAVKRSRPHQSSYQLSQDLHDKQVEMLERKYGGSIRSRRAARTIQRAFRQYCMNKNFQKLRHSCGERRLSKRLSELGRSNTVWTDRLSQDLTTDDNGNLSSLSHSNEEEATFGRNIRNMVADFENARGVVLDSSSRLHAHHSHPHQLYGQAPPVNFDSVTPGIEKQRRASSGSSCTSVSSSSSLVSGQQRAGENINSYKKRLERHPNIVDASTAASYYGKEPASGVPPHHRGQLSRNAFSSPGFNLESTGASYGRHKSGPAMPVMKSSSVGSNSSGGYPDPNSNAGSPYTELGSGAGQGDFMRTVGPESAAVDPHSLDFETLLESKETDILTGSFHSDGSSTTQEISGSGGNSHAGGSGMITRPSTSSLGSGDYNPASDLSRLSSSPAGSFDSFRTLSHDPSDYMTSGVGGGVSGVEVTVDPASPDDPMYSKEQMAAAVQAQMKYYMANSQVKHRSNRDANISSPSSLGAGPPAPPPSNVAIVPPTRAANNTDTSPIWKRKGDAPDARPSLVVANGGSSTSLDRKGEVKRMSNISETSEPDSVEGGVSSSGLSSENVSTENISMGSLGSETSLSYQRKLRMSMAPDAQTMPRTNDKQKKRLYRIGLNLFNKKPERGLDFLLDNLFLEGSAHSVARFFTTRKGLSKQMIGEFLGNLQNPFNQEVLQCFCHEIDLSGLQVDVALRKFQCHFRMPGEAQKIERLMEAFADRYCECNPDQAKKFKSPDTVFLLAFAIIMLNTDLHNPSVKAERKMKLEDFVKNMRGIDDSEDIDRDLLSGIYERVKSQEFKAGVDQVTQVMKVEQTIIGKKPTLSLPHRRLVCYCRLYEVHDPSKKEKIGLHQREVFLFNDLLLVTKIFSKKKTGITYSFRNSLSLYGMQVYLFETSHYQYGIQLTNNIDGKPLITFNARNDHDRQKFVEDLKESILETNGMEQLRIEEEMARHRTTHNTMDKRYACDDSRVLAYDLAKASENPHNRLSAPEYNMKKLPLSNSLTDLTTDPVMKRGSSGASLDSGMASGSVGSTSSDTHPSTVFTPSPTAQPSGRLAPAPMSHLGVAGGKRQQPPPRGPIMFRQSIPDGTEV